MAERTRKTESRAGDRRANRTILGRTIFLMVIFGVVVFIPLFWKLWTCKSASTTSWRSRH
jgi:stage V sporulation protein D (sporulation-specific penicillin-binding protein)